MNLKEKQLNKKEYKLSQINSQLTVKKSKIILLEKDISDLQKENELLKSNLLLARSSNNYHCGKGEIHSTHICDTNNIEKRMKYLEFEMLKMPVGKLDTEFYTNMCRPQKTGNNDLYSARLSNIEHTTGRWTISNL